MKKKGISLITLIITIVVVVVLAAAVVLALSQNNPINDSKIAGITQTRDSLASGILIYATNVQAKTLGNYSVKDILADIAEYKIVVDNQKSNVTKDGVSVEIYKLDYEKVKDKLNIDLKNEKDLWYVDGNGSSYMVYDSIESMPSYLKENGNVIRSVANFVTFSGGTIEGETNVNSNTQGSETPVVTSYTVIYDANGGSGEMSNSTGENVTIATNLFTAPEGKEFDGWNTESDGNGTTYAPGAVVSSNITLYAMWKNTIYTVIYDANGGSGEMSNSTGETVTILANSFTAPEGKEFDYWNTESDGSGTTYAPETTVTSNITLYAIWKNKTYQAFAIGDTVTISNNGTNETFFVIKASGVNQNEVTLITKEFVTTTAQTTSNQSLRFSTSAYWWYGGLKSEYNTINKLNVDIGNILSTDGKTVLYYAQEYGKRIGGTARLLTCAEAEVLQNLNSDLLYGKNAYKPKNRNSMWYWLADAGSNETGKVAEIIDNSYINRNRNSNSEAGGVRPVVTISKDLVTKVTN